MKRNPFPLVVLALVLLFLYLPIVVLTANSFNLSRFGGAWEGFTLKWYVQLLNDNQVWFAFVNSLLIAAGALIDVEDGQGGTYRSPAAPARFPGADATVRPAAPGLGQHTREVLAEIGYAPAEIEAMLASGSAA